MATLHCKSLAWNRPPRLLTVSNYFDSHRGGLEIVAGHLARQLGERGFDVTWLASAATPPPNAGPGLRTVSIGAWNFTEQRLGVPFPILGPVAIGRLLGEIKRADVVLLHDSLYPVSMATVLAARLLRKPLLILQHIGDVPYRSPLLRLLMGIANRTVAHSALTQASQVVFISHVVRDYFAGLKFRSPPLLIFNGVDTHDFRPADGGEKSRIRERLEIASNAPLALFVGRFVEKKGVHLLARVAAARPDLVFAFAGWGVVDPNSWGLANVRVYSDLSGASLADLYRASDVFVLPSKGEGFPLVVQEALACGLPVVCGNESAEADPDATPYLRGVETTSCDEGEAAGRIATAIDQALADENPNDAHRRFEFARQRYAWSAAADQYALILRTLIAKRPVGQEEVL